MSQFWVVGGEYDSTKFDRFVPGKTEERYGPYDDYSEAYKEWQRYARATMDYATVRYKIDKKD